MIIFCTEENLFSLKLCQLSLSLLCLLLLLGRAWLRCNDDHSFLCSLKISNNLLKKDVWRLENGDIGEKIM